MAHYIKDGTPQTLRESSRFYKINGRWVYSRKDSTLPLVPGSAQQNPKTFIRDHAKVGRNDPCPCGSGKKYKKCCIWFFPDCNISQFTRNLLYENFWKKFKNIILKTTLKLIRIHNENTLSPCKSMIIYSAHFLIDKPKSLYLPFLKKLPISLSTGY